MAKRQIQFCSEAAAHKMAEILGDSSAAARALKDLSERRAAGETVALFIDKPSHCFFVGPYPPELADLAEKMRATPPLPSSPMGGGR